MGFFNENGDFVSGATIGGGGVDGDKTGFVSVEVAAACDRVKKGVSTPLDEMRRLFADYPVLKDDDKWSVGEHPISPLLDLYCFSLFGE